MDVSKKLSSLQEISKAQLSKLLNINSNTKHLILEPSLIRPLEKVCGVKWLRGNGVDKIFKLEASTPNFNNDTYFYMIYSDTRTFRQVVDQIRSYVDVENPVRNKFHIIIVPRFSCTYENELEELGKPRLIISLGEFSNALLMQYDQLCDDRGETDRVDCDFGALIMVDRNMDYSSALLTPGTYSSLLSEVYPVSAGICQNKQEQIEKLDEKCNPIVEKQVVSIHLDSRLDNVYCDIKNRYFTEVTSVLSSETKQLKNEQMSSKEMALDEIKNYVQTQLQATKARKKIITNHLLGAESIINILGHRYENQKTIEQNIIRNTDKATNLNFLNELLATENDKFVTLRLFCLIALVQSLSENEIRTFWRKFLHQFGFQFGFAFSNLISTGFVPEPAQGSSSFNLQGKIKIPMFASSNFQVNAKNLKQIPSDPEKINLKHPTCASYVFAGNYIPLITQIAGMLLNSVPLDEIKIKLEVFGKFTVRNDRGYPLNSRTILIYVLGGVTYAEIAACNLLESMTGAKICILSDKIVTGNDLMKGILNYPN
ncbi:hypothetical protein JTB14_022232 [Gonioctena quinquepunctata]|nr:hypothetical protein JTB14_022232 [Gonioctena quinquepunctata]